MQMIGFAVAMSTLLSAASSFSYSRIKGRLSFYSVFFLGYLIMAIGMAMTAWASTFLTVLVAMMFTGFGIGMMIPNTNLWIMQVTPAEIRGKEIGKLTFFWFIGQFLSPIITWPLAKSYELPNIFYAAAMVLLALAFVFLALHTRGARSK